MNPLEALSELGIEPSDDGSAAIDLAQLDRGPNLASGLAKSFEILIEDGDDVNHDARRPDKFGEDLHERFLESSHHEVHRALFALADRHGYVWLEGLDNYGLRVARSTEPKSVNVVTSDAPGRLKIVLR